MHRPQLTTFPGRAAGARLCAAALALLLGAAAPACTGDDTAATATATPAAGSSPVVTSTPDQPGQVVEVGATPEPTATPAHPGARADIDQPIPFSSWVGDNGRIRVNFVTAIHNVGSVPLDASGIRWALNDRAGAPFAFGEVAYAYPRRLAPGETGIVGASLGNIAYSDPKEVTGVSLLFDATAAEQPDTLLEVAGVEVQTGDDGTVGVTGSVRNTSGAPVERLRIGIVLQDAEGRWLAFARGTAEAGDRLGAGEETPFRSDDAFPPELPAPPASALVIAFDDAGP